MKKDRQIGQRIKKFREDHYPNQKALAEALGVGQTVVSAWETGDNMPSSEAWAKLGNVAPYPENLWFWQQGGLDLEELFSAAAQILKERGMEPAPGEIVRISFSSENLRGREEPGASIPLPAKFVPNRLSTRYLVVDENLADSTFPVGDVIFLEKSAKNAEEFRPFWGEIVLVHLTRPKDRTGLRMTEFWKEGLNIGRLWCKMNRNDPLYYLATLGPFGDAETRYRSGDQVTLLGTWQHELRNNLPYMGMPESQTAIAEVRDEARSRALMEMRPCEGCRILGRVIGWFRAPREELK